MHIYIYTHVYTRLHIRHSQLLLIARPFVDLGIVCRVVTFSRFGLSSNCSKVCLLLLSLKLSLCVDIYLVYGMCCLSFSFILLYIYIYIHIYVLRICSGPQFIYSVV